MHEGVHAFRVARRGPHGPLSTCHGGYCDMTDPLNSAPLYHRHPGALAGRPSDTAPGVRGRAHRQIASGARAERPLPEKQGSRRPARSSTALCGAWRWSPAPCHAKLPAGRFFAWVMAGSLFRRRFRPSAHWPGHPRGPEFLGMVYRSRPSTTLFIRGRNHRGGGAERTARALASRRCSSFEGLTTGCQRCAICHGAGL